MLFLFLILQCCLFEVLNAIPTLQCINPTHVRIAGHSVEFLARLTYSTSTDLLGEPSNIDLSGIFDGSQLHQLISADNAHVFVKATKNTTMHDFSWTLTGFEPAPHHTYTLWVTTKDSNSLINQKLISCTSSFETVHFPGWDSYVQSFYNTTKTIETLNEQPAITSRVGKLNHSINSFERMPDLIGPQLTDSIVPDTLIVTFAGKNSIRQIDSLAKKFTKDPSISFMLFAYDRTNWAQFDWVEKSVVIRVTKQMKWRFVKTFLHPAVVSAYHHLIIMDEDCAIDRLNITSFVEDMKRDKVMIGQPSNGEGSYGSHEVVRQQIGRSTVFTNFAECGPLIAFDTLVWPCVFDLLQSDVTCGYGYDLIWSHCGATAVLHQHEMVHENRKPASSRPNFVMRCAAEGLALFQRLAFKGLAPFDPSEI